MASHWRACPIRSPRSARPGAIPLPQSDSARRGAPRCNVHQTPSEYRPEKWQPESPAATTGRASTLPAPSPADPLDPLVSTQRVLVRPAELDLATLAGPVHNQYALILLAENP